MITKNKTSFLPSTIQTHFYSVDLGGVSNTLNILSLTSLPATSPPFRSATAPMIAYKHSTATSFCPDLTRSLVYASTSSVSPIKSSSLGERGENSRLLASTS